ncbi:ankyrin [Penicillium robsamsonii]|uniref:ankyrin n=1 Tax=Penicillium robsamsonii TaxID=1792511 RepID=UPI00254841E5|nr:ankyrin [Penicillium robsamsonii]KAJ5826584.1 ankyrin [Penicillium robsamsonii]
MSDPKEYTIGWICAISTEYTAAQAFLDEKHQAPDFLSSADNNDYACGRIGKHQVVIAVLPDGEYGISSAANVARDMLHSFPNIRIGLLIGIGGGVPSSKHDIRLGDIVVSTPRNGNSGIFQYDFGKTIQGQPFQATGVLNQPPSALRAAVSGLKSQYECESHQLEKAVNRVLERNPRLRKKYKRPESGSDRLYRSDFIHPLDNETGCAVACGDDLSRLIMRHKRTADEDNPAIHYGLIASANQLMKDALVRDRLTAESGVLCFEMEAAGLMNHFPCLVIRGICDYADSHKNKDWQGYAAMVAAAYARDLLYRLTPNRVENEKRINEVLLGIHATISRVEVNVGIISSKFNRNKELEALDWLTHFDYGPQQSDLLRLRQPGTSKWLIESAEYKDWRETNEKTLLCSGIPGAGKTILTAVVIDDLATQCLNNHTLGLAYIYCDFRRKDDQKAENLLASILKQLSHCRSPLPTSVKMLYEQHKDRRTRPSLNELFRSLQFVASLYAKVFVVIDALDECKTSDDSRNVFLSRIFDLQKVCSVNILATSRPVPEIMERFSGDKLEIRAHESDVEKYLEGRISQAGSELLNTHKEEIKRRITELADGMFLLAHLLFDSIKTKITLKQIKETLSRISKGPEAYEKAYKDAQCRIEGQNPDASKLAMDVLMWITCSKRQLSSWELQEALAVEPGTLCMDKDNIPQVKTMVSVCAGLVVVDEESKIMRLVHHTAQEYFERNQNYWFPSAESRLTIVCVTYLSFDLFETGFCVNDEDFEIRIQQNPLYDYAARNWGHHARAAGIETASITQSLLKSNAKVCALSQALTVSKPKWYPGYSQGIRQMTALHLAAYFGIKEAATQVLESQGCWDIRDSDGRTPLSWAAENGHLAIVELLLENGAYLRSRDNFGRTPLSRAAANGHENIIKLLLERRTNFLKAFSIIRKILIWKTAKLISSILGHASALSLSLPFKSKTELNPAFEAIEDQVTPCEDWREAVNTIDLQDDIGRTPLYWAIVKQHTRSVDLLLQQGASTDLCDKESKCAIHFAAEIGNEALVQRLLQNSEMIEAKDRHGRSPLLCAVENLHAGVIHSLVQAGAQVNVFNNMHKNPLHLISRGPRHKDRFALLGYFISQGTSTGLCDVKNMTPFLYALVSRSEDLALLFLDTGFEVNFGLHRRCWTRRMENVLETYGLDESFERSIRGESSVGLTALHFTALNGIVGMTMFLLNHGADPNAIDEDGDTPLHLAIRCQIGGHKYDDPWVTGEYAVETLSDIITDYEEEEEANEVWEVIDQARESTVQQLLKSPDIDVNIANNNGEFPLHVIPFETGSAHLAFTVLSALLDHGAHVSRLNSKRQSCLHLASKAGNLDAVRILVEKGGDITLLDVYNLSPVHYAVCHNHSDVIRLMYENCHEQLSRICVQYDDLGKSMLHYHAESLMCSTEMISLLMKLGCDVDKLDTEGNSALSQYLRSFHLQIKYDVFKLLRERSRTEGIRWTDQKQRNLLHLLMRQWSDDNVHILEDLMDYVDITTKDAYGMGIEHHGAIHGAFNKFLTRFLRKRAYLNLHSKDFKGKTPLQYAEEEANRKRHRNLFQGHRWQRSLQNLRDGDEND